MLTTVLDMCRRARLIGDAWIGLLAFDIARLAGFARLHAFVRGLPVSAPGVRPRTTEEVIWAVDEACVWYVRPALCLQRSAVATWLLRRHGIHAALVVGYRPLPFESHAWVEVDGIVVNDRQQYARVFTVLDRL